ncbi:response regulator transcription factor [Amycolatopsis jejuensis]|uniref:response regulator transcription factor n=1 Tax=Amycolatopsis jejuensis TaxID=330084 RepID=UPI001FDF1B8C|nr:response regulator [Amycolatopsis jejuensis]
MTASDEVTAIEPATEDGVVYIVDDDSELCTSLAWLLESVGVASRCFGSVREFLDADLGTVPACLVLDVRMPEIGGFELQEHLSSAGSVIPIVFVSAHGDIRMSVRALQKGALDFLPKPYDPQHMIEVVQGALRTARERFARAAEVRELQERLARLTPRELEIVRLVVDGMSSKRIATRLGISVKTVDVHRARAREKTGAETVAQLVRDVLQLGVELPG